MTPPTIPALFLHVCSRFSGHANKTAYAKKHRGMWQPVTHDELYQHVEGFALGLQQLGIAPGERVGIVAENRVEWAVADFALSIIGAVDVPVFPTLTPQQEQYIFSNCSVSCVIVSNQFQLSKLLKIRHQLPSLRNVIVMNDDVAPTDGVVTMSSVTKAGHATADTETKRTAIEALVAKVAEQDLLTIIYTSGTTGHPKGVMLSHRNLLSNVYAAIQTIPVNEHDVLLSYLPLCHSYERMSGYYLAFSIGASVYMSESIEAVAENLREVRPTVMTSVPRFFERVKQRIEHAIEKESRVKRAIFSWSFKVGSRFLHASEEGKVSPILRFQRSIADKLVFMKIRQRTGGRLRFFVSGGAALNVDVGRFFAIAGIHILEGYGLTETSPVLTINRLGDECLGTVGMPLSNVEITIADDGEVLARGPNVMLGYWKDDAATRDVIDTDGWFHTGDIGEFDSSGRLRITDRKKHILVSSTGKNIAPQPIEQLLLQSSFIDQIMLVGDAREYCTALVVPDEDAVRSWALRSDQGSESLLELQSSKELYDAIMQSINNLQRDLAKYERVRRIAILQQPFTVENDMMTPTLKIKRNVALRVYTQRIEQMYA